MVEPVRLTIYLRLMRCRHQVRCPDKGTLNVSKNLLSNLIPISVRRVFKIPENTIQMSIKIDAT